MPKMDDAAERPLAGEAAAYWLFIALMTAVALSGGSSRYDSMAQIVVRVAAVAAMLGWTALPGRERAAELWRPFAFVATIAAVALIQLVPLPPSLWTAAPGRGFYADLAGVAGIEQPWRPLNLSPDRGRQSLLALVVPLATLVGLSRLGERHRLALVGPLLILVVSSAVLGLAQLSTGRQSALRWYAVNNDRFATGFFANRNHQAVLLSLALPLLAVWASRPGKPGSTRRHRAWLAAGCGAFLLLMVPTTGSRSGLAAVVVALAGAIALAAPAFRRFLGGLSRRRRRAALAAGAAGLSGFAVLAWALGRNDALGRLRGLDVTEDLRARLLPTVIEMTREFFPVGSGMGSFEAVYRRFEPFDMLSTSYRNMAHNDLLQVVLEAGAAGLLLLVAFVLWWAWRTWGAWRAEPSAATRAARAASVMLAILLGASAVDYPLRTPLMMMVATIAAVWLEGIARPGRAALLRSGSGG